MKARRKGFTLIELLVVLATVALLVVTLLPALAGTRQNAQVINCLANQKRLVAGWMMYARDNNDVLVPNRGLAGQSSIVTNPRTNPDLQPGGPFAQWCPGNMRNITVALNYDQWIKAGWLYPYLNKLTVYHCPSDQNRIPRGVAPAFQKPALRTYSMNAWVQSMDGSGYATIPWNGINGYTVYTKLSNISRPVPGKTWVFIEESASTIDEGYFAVDPTQSKSWYSLPAVLHGNASVMAFADGHVGAHRWTDANMIYGNVGNASGNNVPADPNSQDLPWLISITTTHQ